MLASELPAFVTNDEPTYVAKQAALYDYLQLYMPSRTFDIADIAASFIGATLSLIVVTLVFLMDYGTGSRQNKQ